jgi:hypothetical protein
MIELQTARMTVMDRPTIIPRRLQLELHLDLTFQLLCSFDAVDALADIVKFYRTATESDC